MEEEQAEIEARYVGEEIFGWMVDEYERHERGPVWYAIAFLVGLSLVLYAIVTRNFLFAVVIIMAGVIVALSAMREPQKIQFLVTTRGVALGHQFVPYKELRSFWILYEPPHLKNLYVDFRSPITPHLVIPIEDQDPVELRQALLEFIAENETQEEEPLTDILGRFLKI
ncbi:MAG: hypothetical protein WC866_00020 [Patescibacteria group bacterium]|jgi:hypothetical protein